MTTISKLVLGVFSLGSASGIAYAGSVYFGNSENIKQNQEKSAINDLIQKEFKYVLLNTTSGSQNTDQTHWSTIWTNYKRDNSTNQDVFGLDGWAQKGEKDLTDLLKAKCQQLSNSTVQNSDEHLYKNVTKYCSREATLADEVAKNKLREIDATGNTEDSKLWEARKNKKKELQEKLNTLSMTDESLDADKLKKGCLAAKTKKRNENNYAIFYEAYKVVCTKQEGET